MLIQLITFLSVIIIAPAMVMTLQNNFTGAEYYIILVTFCILTVLWYTVIKAMRGGK